MKTPEAIEILKNELDFGNDREVANVPKYNEVFDAIKHITALHTGGRTEPCCEEFYNDVYLFYMRLNGLKPSFNYCPYCGAYIRDIQIPAK